MTAPIPVNPSLPSNWQIPGIYISLDLRGASAGIGSLDKRILLVGHKTSDGIAPLNTVLQVLGQSHANLLFGRGSDLARQHKATLAQIGSGMADVFAVAAPEPLGGAASTHLITFIGDAKGAGSVEIAVCGLTTTVAIANLDTASAIAASVAGAVNNDLPDAPVIAQASGPTVTLTYRVAGEVGNDLPIIVTFSGDSGVQASPGMVSFNGLGVSDGSVVVDIGTTAVQASIKNGDTGVTIAQSLAQAFAVDAYPCTAAVTGPGALTLYYAPGRVVHRIAAAVYTTMSISVAVAVGAAGKGEPQLTTTLGYAGSQAAFGCWSSAFADLPSLGAIAVHIEHDADGLRQKDQELFIGSTDSLAKAAAIAPNSTPALSASPRYAIGWCPDAPEQAYELAARMAALVAVEDYYPYNYDGEPLETDDTTPLQLPHVNTRPDDGECNAAINLGLTPLVVDEAAGKLVILSDRTTMQTTDDRLWAWGTIRTLAFYRADLRTFLKQRFSHKNVKLDGTPRTANTVKLDSIRDAVLERMRSWDNADLFDGIDAVKDQIQVTPNAQNRRRVDIFVPCRPPRKLSQLSADAALV